MTNQVIPDAAVEAALISTYGNPRNGNEPVWQSMRAALQAAARHMTFQAWSEGWSEGWDACAEQQAESDSCDSTE